MLFYQFHVRITTFSSKKCLVWLLSKKLTKCLAQNEVKIDILTSCTKLSYTPSYKTEIPRTGQNCGKPCWVCKYFIFQYSTQVMDRALVKCENTYKYTLSSTVPHRWWIELYCTVRMLTECQTWEWEDMSVKPTFHLIQHSAGSEGHRVWW